MKFIKWIPLLVAFAAFASCARDTGTSGSDYGYVQFRLFKSGSYDDNTRAGTGRLDSLYAAAKMKITLSPAQGNNIVQTVPLGGQGTALAEYGMQSDKFLLLAGDYKIVEYILYDKVDRVITGFRGEPDSPTTVKVVSGGLTLQDIVVNTLPRGFVKFQLTKANVEDITPTRAGDPTPMTHAFHTVTGFDVTVYSDYWLQEVTFKKLEVEHKYFHPEGDHTYYTSVAVADSVARLRAGEWRVTGVKVYYDFSLRISEDLTVMPDNSFVVYDNGLTEADVPVTLTETAGDIRDAIVLKQIWEALGGNDDPALDKWKVRWDFNRDIDLWTAQPGVSVLTDGRVAVLDLSDVGAVGEMPAAIGQLTELRQLYLGMHSWVTGTSSLNPASKKKYTHTYYDENNPLRWNASQDFHSTFIDNGTSYHKFSKELQESFAYGGIEIKEQGPKLRALPVGNPVNYSNLITSLPDEINNLKKLESVYIGYSAMTTLPGDLSGCEALTDLELFNCPNLTDFPAGIATLPKLVTLIFSSNFGLTTDRMYNGLVALNAGAAAKYLQTLQISGQPVTKIPDLTNMGNLGQLDVQNCGLTEFEAHFNNHVIKILNASHNSISDLPRDADNRFTGFDGEVETFNFSHNEFTEFPDIFDAKSDWTISTVDFSYNKITEVENAAAAGADASAAAYHGLNSKFLMLSYNRFPKFPKEILHKGSTIGYLQIQGNQIENMDDDTFDILKANKTPYLTTLDLSYNKLTKLPTSFNGENLSYMTGLDLSYNRLNFFPKNNVLNIAAMTVFIFRGQRDGNGNRIMQEWPQGIYNHKGMRALYIGSNDLRLVDDTLSYLISSLEIADNPNITIDVSSLCYYISYGYMRFVYDPWQDIRGCPTLRLDKKN